MTLRMKIGLLILLVVAGGGALHALAAGRLMRGCMEAELKDRAVILADALAEHLAEHMINWDVLYALECVRDTMNQMEDVEYIYVEDFDGRLFCHTFEGGFPKALVHAALGMPVSEGVRVERFSTERGNILEVDHPLLEGTMARFHIGVNEKYMHARISRMRDQIIGISLGVAALGLLAGIALSRPITRPLKRLSESMLDYGKGRIAGGIAYYGGGPEVAEMTQSFNLMVAEKKETEDALAQYRGRLEQLVEERTGQLRDAQEELVRRERLAVLGKFSSGISHEIRNPLGVIDSSARFLQMTLNEADEKTRLHLDRIRDQVRISNAIIQSLQDLTRMKDPRREQVDLADVIKEALEISGMPQGVEVIDDVPENEFFVDADTQQLCMAFKNIATNAAQAMNDKGTFRITVVKAGNESIEVSFIDTGPGIAAKEIEMVCQPFFSTKAHGIGFGLAICKMIIEKHGGTIEVRSEPGKGATFTVRLPSRSAGRGKGGGNEHRP